MSKLISVFGPSVIDHTISIADPISIDGSSLIESERLDAGGTGLCYAIALARLDNFINFHSVIGDDQFASQIELSINQENLIRPVWQRISGPTDHAYVLVGKGNHKTVASKKEISNTWDPAKCPPLHYSQPDAIVITSFSNFIAKGILSALSTNYLYSKPFVLWAPHKENCKQVNIILDYLHLIDHLTLSLEEYQVLLEQIGDPHRFGIKTITVTHGKDGCDLIFPDHRVHYRAHEVVENPHDTNGAGEAFGAAFLSAYLLTTDIDLAVKAGCYNGFLHVHRPASDFPTLYLPELLVQLSNHD